MKPIKRFNYKTEKNGLTRELDILIYDFDIIWYLIESTKHDDVDEFTEDQSYDDYLKNGPPHFASDLPADIKDEIYSVIKSRDLN